MPGHFNPGARTWAWHGDDGWLFDNSFNGREKYGGGPYGPGDVIGWSWLYPPYYWHFGARAIQRTTATFYYGTRLREECEENPAFGYELMKRISQVLLDRLQFPLSLL